MIMLSIVNHYSHPASDIGPSLTQFFWGFACVLLPTRDILSLIHSHNNVAQLFLVSLLSHFSNICFPFMKQMIINILNIFLWSLLFLLMSFYIYEPPFLFFFYNFLRALSSTTISFKFFHYTFLLICKGIFSKNCIIFDNKEF